MDIGAKYQDLITVTIVCTKKELQDQLQLVFNNPDKSTMVSQLRDIAYPAEAKPVLLYHLHINHGAGTYDNTGCTRCNAGLSDGPVYELVHP